MMRIKRERGSDMELHAAADASTQPPRTEIGLQDMDSDAIS